MKHGEVMDIIVCCSSRRDILINKPLKNFSQRAEEIADTLRAKPQNRSIFLDVISRIDADEIARLQDKYSEPLQDFIPAGVYKYVDLPFWISEKVNTAISLGLHRCDAKSILDIGMGGGHFALVCETLGHKVVGTDKNVPLYNDICRIFRLDRRIITTEIRTPLPDLGVKFDFITVIGQVFNIIKPVIKNNVQYWTTDDWEFFLKDLVTNHMQHPGTIFLQLNSNIVGSGTARDKVLLQWTRDHGATADEITNRVLFNDVHGWETFEVASGIRQHTVPG